MRLFRAIYKKHVDPIANVKDSNFELLKTKVLQLWDVSEQHFQTQSLPKSVEQNMVLLANVCGKQVGDYSTSTAAKEIRRISTAGPKAETGLVFDFLNGNGAKLLEAVEKMEKASSQDEICLKLMNSLVDVDKTSLEQGAIDVDFKFVFKTLVAKEDLRIFVDKLQDISLVGGTRHGSWNLG